ncbi:uncharacterized protein LOC121379239 [Gigantopelta aegis]|uniref:uncharacterized protein LOC121379239 n=1 Tax=Gigantopelta aegis TaxID=1735272 RepID=UPI001B889553|nr:uncharacterized protein LOC121379239 [Gigantopelta aegis]
MDSIIQKFDFLKVTSDSKDDFSTRLDEWKDDNDEKLDKQMVKKSLEVAMAKVCVPDFPGKDTESGSAAETAFDNVLSVMSDVVDQEKATAVEMHDLLLNCMIKLLLCGPGTTHINIMTQITHFSEFLNYTEALEGEKLKQYLNALKREYTTREQIEPKVYASDLKSVLQSVVDNGFQSDQVEANSSMFVEFFIYFEFGSFPNSSNHVIAVMRKVSDWIDYKANRKIYKKITDPSMIKDLIHRFQDMICTKTFPTDEKQLKKVTSSLEKFLNGLKSNLQFEAVCDAFTDFCLAVFNKPGEKVPAIVKVIGDFFYHIEEKAVKNKTAVFVSVIKATTEIVKKLDPEYRDIRFASGIASDVLVKAMNNSSKDHVVLLVDFMKACLKIPNKWHFEAAYYCMREKQVQIKWKEQLDSAKEIFKIVSETEIPEGDKQEKTIKALTEFTEYFLESVK